MKLAFILLCAFQAFTVAMSVAVGGNIYNSQFCNGSIYAQVVWNPIGCVQFFPGTFYQVKAGNTSFSIQYCNNSLCNSGCNETVFNYNTCVNATDGAEGIVNYGNFTKLDALPTLFGTSDQDNVAVYFGADSNCTYPTSANEIEIYKPGCQLQNGGNNPNNTFYALIKCSTDRTNVSFFTCRDSNCSNCTLVESQPAGKCVNSSIGGGYTSFYCGQVTLTAPNTTANSTNNNTTAGAATTSGGTTSGGAGTTGIAGGTTSGTGATTGSTGSGVTTSVIPEPNPTTTTTGSTSTTGTNSASVFSVSAVLILAVFTILI